MRIALVSLSCLLFLTMCGCGDESGEPAPPIEPIPASHTWPRFRGPGGGGVADEGATLPAKLDPARHTVWKTAVDAPGNSSPIVWGDRIFLTAEGHRILAFDRRDGRKLWETALTPPPSAGDEPFEPGEYGTASATACTDGRHVAAFFGTGVLGCVDVDGRPLWAKRLVDPPKSFFGLAASPVMHDGAVIQVVDQDADDRGDEPVYRSFVVALGASDGEQRWRTDRAVRGSWATPLVIGGRPALVTCAEPRVLAYDPRDGSELWRADGLTGDVAASPVACGDTLYAFSDPSGPVMAIRLGGGGDVTDTHVRWTFDMDLPDVASGLCDGRRVMYLSDYGTLRCLDAQTGEPTWSLDLPELVYASPILVGGKLVLIDTAGVLTIVDPAAGTAEHTVALGERVNASPAPVGRFLYVRTTQSLMCLGEPAGP